MIAALNGADLAVPVLGDNWFRGCQRMQHPSIPRSKRGLSVLEFELFLVEK